MSAWESLGDWDLPSDRLPEMRERLRARREYPAAVRRLAANMVRDAAEDPALSGLLKDAGRTVAALSATHLGLSGDITLARLRSFVADFGLVSAGRVRALLGYMQHLGYVEPDPSTLEARRAAFRITASFLASYTRHEQSLLDAVQVVEPAAACVLNRLDAPGVLRMLVAHQAQAFARGSGQARAYADWYGVFMHRLAGIQILHALVAEADDFPATEIKLAPATLARRFGVSRMHVATMFEDAERLGFVERARDRGRFTPAGLEALDWLYASRLCVHLACVARTAKALPDLGIEKAA